MNYREEIEGLVIYGAYLKVKHVKERQYALICKTED